MLKQRPNGDHLATARLSFAKATQVVWCGAVARAAPSCAVSFDLKFDTMFSDTSSTNSSPKCRRGEVEVVHANL